eukprot:c15636_g1_i1 orf=346-681(-)
MARFLVQTGGWLAAEEGHFLHVAPQPWSSCGQLVGTGGDGQRLSFLQSSGVRRQRSTVYGSGGASLGSCDIYPRTWASSLREPSTGFLSALDDTLYPRLPSMVHFTSLRQA